MTNTKSIFIEKIERQQDGAYTIYFNENGVSYKQLNAGICCNGQYYHGTGNDSDTRIYLIGFEIMPCYYPPTEV
jgi:hypothetical protein